MIKRSLITAAALLVLITVPGRVVSADTLTTGAAHSINNDTVGVDYKLTGEEQKSIVEMLRQSGLASLDKDESDKYINKDTTRQIDLNSYQEDDEGGANKSVLSDVAAAKSYLIQNNILERKKVLKWGNDYRYTAVSYEEAGERWDNVFETSYNNYYKSVTEDNATTAYVKQQFKAYCNKVTADGLWNLLEGTNSATAADASSVKSKLSSWRKSFNQEVTEADNKAALTSKYRSYMREVFKLAKNYKPARESNDESIVNKTEMLVLLCKAAYGAQSSRPIVFRNSAVRNNVTYSSSTSAYWEGGFPVSFLDKYWDTYDVPRGAYFAGDYYYYVTSNVYEMYVKLLLDKGIIYTDELGNSEAATKFKQDYKRFSKAQPAWYSGKGLCLSGYDNGLGEGLYFSGNGLEYTDVNFFANEELTKLDVLKYVEDVLRTLEKNITKKEADIVVYKYGIDYLSEYSESEQDTLKFLIAKGIINFENPGEFLSLGDTITYGELYSLLYRVANPDVRYDFSQVTLTDCDSYWMEHGYAQSDVGINSVSSGFLMTDGSAEEVKDSVSAEAVSGFVFRLANFFGIQTATADKRTFHVTFKLSKDVPWEYTPPGNGKKRTLKDIAESGDSVVGISSITNCNVNYNGKKVAAYKIVMNVQTDSAGKALSNARKRLSCTGVSSGAGIQTVTKVKDSSTEAVDQEEYTLVTEDSFKQEFSEIVKLEDKVLLNTTTGAQAILYADSGKALVGNTIIETDGFIVQDVNGTVYYNLKVILALLDDVYLKKIGIKATLFRMPALKDGKRGKVFETYRTDVSNEYDIAGDTKATIAKVKITNKMLGVTVGDVGDVGEYSAGSNAYYYKVDDVTNGLNTMVKDYSIKVGDSTTQVTLVLDWNFVIPEIETFSRNSELAAKFSDSKTLTQKKVVKWLYTRPKTPALRMWWDSNYTANNSLVNFMMGTAAVDYVQSGYLAPSVTVLVEKKKLFKTSGGDGSVRILNALFADKLALKGYEGKNYEEEDGTDYLKGFFNGDAWYLNFFGSSTTFDSVDTSSGPYSGKGVEKVLEDISNLAYRSRSLKVLPALKVNARGGTSYGMDFFRTTSGVLFRNVDRDSRVAATVIKDRVTDLEVATRTATLGDVQVYDTVYADTPDGKQALIYRGVKDNMLLFTPKTGLIKRDVSDDLYNGGYLSVNTSTSSDYAGSLNFVTDRGYASVGSLADSLLHYNGTGSYNKTANYERYSNWKELYSAWLDYYVGIEAAPPSSVTPADVFQFNSKCMEIAGLSSSGESVSFLNLSPAVQKKVQNIVKKAKGTKGGADKNTLLKAVAGSFTLASGQTAELGKFNGGVNLTPKEAARGASKKAAEGALAGIDRKGKYLIGNRVSYTRKTLGGESEDEAEKAYSEGKFRYNSLGVKSGKNVSRDTFVVYAVPTFYLSASDFLITQSSDGSTFNLSSGGSSVAICFSNYYYSGIIKSVQEASIAEYVKTMKLGSVSAGSTVSIGGIRFKVDKQQPDKNGVWLTSVKLNTLGKRTVLRDAAANWVKYDKLERKEGNVSVNKFKQQVSDIFKDTIIRCDGAMFSLVDYIAGYKKTGKESPVRVGALVKDKKSRKNGMLFEGAAGKIYGYKKGKSRLVTAKNSADYQYVAIRFKLSKELRVRPLNDERTLFTLTNTSTTGIAGADNDNVWFYGEQLSYDDNLFADVSIDSTRYAPSALFNSAKKEFMALYAEAMTGDVKTLILAIICSVAIYMSVMSWMAYAVLHYNVMRILFTAIASGSGPGSNGLDLVKFFTLGVYTLDDDPPLYRVIVIQFICAMIAAVAVNLR